MRRWLPVALKLTVTVALVAVVLVRVDLGGVATALGGLSAAAIGLGIALTFASVAVSAWRWHRVLVYLGERVPPWALAGDTLVGTTYNLLLPTSIGGDVARAIRCGRRVQEPGHAWASVGFERLLGLLSLALVSAVGLGFGVGGVRPTVLFAAVGMAVALVVAVVFAPTPLRLAARLASGGSTPVAGTLERVASAWSGALSRPAPRLETFLWSVAYQLVALTILVPVAWDWPVPNLAYAIYLGVPIALVAATLPISLGGHGLRESLFVVVLVPFGFAPPLALALSLVWLASNLLVGLAGLVVLLGSSPASAPPLDARRAPPSPG
jgi:uncharacterized membrane protein YbhN (UPF0104 family)